MTDIDLPNDGEEPNVEGLVGEFLGRTPWEDPLACRNIVRLYRETVELFLSYRADRHRREEEGEAELDGV